MNLLLHNSCKSAFVRLPRTPMFTKHCDIDPPIYSSPLSSNSPVKTYFGMIALSRPVEHFRKGSNRVFSISSIRPLGPLHIDLLIRTYHCTDILNSLTNTSVTTVLLVFRVAKLNISTYIDHSIRCIIKKWHNPVFWAISVIKTLNNEPILKLDISLYSNQ